MMHPCDNLLDQTVHPSVDHDIDEWLNYPINTNNKYWVLFRKIPMDHLTKLATKIATSVDNNFRARCVADKVEEHVWANQHALAADALCRLCHFAARDSEEYETTRDRLAEVIRDYVKSNDI